MNHTTKLLIRSLNWFTQSVRTVDEVNAYLLALSLAGIADSELGEVILAFCRAEMRGEANQNQTEENQ